MAHSIDGSAIDLPLGLDHPLEVAAPSADEPAAARRIVLALFDEHRAGALRYARSFGLADGVAEDVVQEAFLALFVHVSRGGARTNLTGWIFRVTQRVALRQRARDARRARLAWWAGVRPPDAIPNPEEQLAAGRRRARLSAAVSALPECDRRCLILRAEGVRYRDIARQLGISLGSVANAIARSLARLRSIDER